MLRRTFLKFLSSVAAGGVFSDYLSRKPASERGTIWVSMKPQPPKIATYRGYNCGAGGRLRGWDSDMVYVEPANPLFASTWSPYPKMKKNGNIVICCPYSHSITVTSKSGKTRKQVNLPYTEITPPFRPGQRIIDHNNQTALVTRVKLRNTQNIELGRLVEEGYHHVDDLCKELKISFNQLKDWWTWELSVNDVEHYKHLWKNYQYIFSQTKDPWVPE
jgi:hypothetical protein